VALASGGAEQWIQVKSDTFVVRSSVGEERGKQVLRELEAFHQLVGTALVFQKVQLPELPIEVLIVGDEQLLTELSPEFNGRKIRVAGFYSRGQDRDFIILSGNSINNRTRTVYHELTHYFVSRSLQPRPTWLNEGLAEYFATAEIDDDFIYLGGLSPDRMEFLKTERLLPLKDFFAVNDRSIYYNESLKANVFYSQAWAFVHFLTHGQYKAQFKRYLEDLGSREVAFSDYISTDIRDLETEFNSYLKIRIRSVSRDRLKTSAEGWSMTVQTISEPDVELSIAEVFLASGRLNDARKHLEKVAGLDDEFPRASYYRGVLARISGEGDPREFFIDALMDLNLGPRAAVHLVQLGELSPPAIRRALEQAAAARTHMSDVYWALSEIYLADARLAEETLKLRRIASIPAPAPRVTPPADSSADPVYTGYAQAGGDHFKYELLAESGTGPKVANAVAPFFPEELLAERLSGRVVIDVQVTETGDVGGVWLISSTPEIFSALATAVIREWKFEAVPGKIRVILHFVP